MFSNDLDNSKEYQANRAVDFISRQKDDYILNCDFVELVEGIFNQFSFENIEIDERPEYKWIEPQNADRNYILECRYKLVSGSELLDYRPSFYSMTFGANSGIPMRAIDEKSNQLYLVFRRVMDIDVVEKKHNFGLLTTENLDSLFLCDTTQFFGNVNHLKHDISSANDFIKGKIQRKLEEIYTLANRKISLRNALKISVMPISDIRNKKIEVKIIEKKSQMPKANVSEPYYYISNEDYDLIIQIINKCMTQYERTSKTLKDLDEEDIRNLILGAINSNFNFAGSAESFSNKGHTDIMIEANNKAAFIAECKLWKGKSYVSSGIDQLLSYATYKDGKLALLVFNKSNKDFNKVLIEMESLIEEHSMKMSMINHKDNLWQYKFRSMTNETSVTITFIVANYYFS